MSYLLELDKVHKQYRSVVAVNQLSLKVPPSCIFGLLGPNGAGKTSLIRIITGITRPDSGTIRFMGKEMGSEQYPLIGYMPEERGLYKKMTVGEQLVYLCRLKGFSRQQADASVRHWMEKFEILSWWNKKIEELSKGMSQKVQFIATVAHKPRLIILDEPFSGLDPINTNLIKEEIIQLRNEGAGILFSTHRMEQVEELCEEIVLVNRGSNVLSGPVADIRRQYRENLYEVSLDRPVAAGGLDGYHLVSADANDIRVRLAEGQSTNGLISHLIAGGYHLQGFREVLPTFNDIFIRTVNEASHA